MIALNIENLKGQIAITAEKAGRSPEDVKLVAVSKRFPVSAIHQAYQCGQLHFGENYIQELQGKVSEIPPGAKVHFIGHLQSNKAKIAAEHCHMIETVDSAKLAKKLNNHLLKLEKKLKILVQVNIGGDQNKAGIAPEAAEKLLDELAELDHLEVCGLMTIPPVESDTAKTRGHFVRLRKLGDKLYNKGFFTTRDTVEFSMGMSQDFPIAIEEGATIIRVGTAIFGQRPPLL